MMRQVKVGIVIDGVAAAQVLQPETNEEVAAALRDASARGLRVAPLGGGTHLQIGYPPVAVDVALDLSNLAGVVSYQPQDLTVSVRAGTTAGALASTLAECAQRLPLDVEQPSRATVGGMAAVAHAGPRRFGLGGFRDLLIGMRVVLADGTIVKTGGMVVKNVAGYDLSKLFHGSLGSLGVIVELNFKTLAKPRIEAVVTAQCETFASALCAARAAYEARLPFSGIVAASDGRLYVGCEGRERDVDTLAAAASEAAERFGGAPERVASDAKAAAKLWSGISPLARPAYDAVFRISGAPSETPGLAKSALEAAGGRSRIYACADIGNGAVDLGVATDEFEQPRAEVAALEAKLAESAPRLRVLRCPPDVRSKLCVFLPEPQTLQLMRELKAKFDPAGVLNVGRNVGHV